MHFLYKPSVFNYNIVNCRLTHDSEWDYENVRVFTTDTNMKCAVVALSITILIYSILINRSLINRFAVLNCIAWETF